jgi:signal transduction histidine kinase
MGQGMERTKAMQATAETAIYPAARRNPVAGNPVTGVRAGASRGRAQAFAETLAFRGGRSETLSELAHDARNMVQALELYCDLLEEPGILNPASSHYAGELRLVAAASRRLVEKLALLGKKETAAARTAVLSMALPESPIENLREEVLGVRNLLDALAGPGIRVVVAAEEGALPVWLTTEDLTRILVNLVKNAAEAIAGNRSSSRAGAGRIEITLRERAASADAAPALLLAVEDSGPGIDPGQLEAIFEPGFTTSTHAKGSWPAAHRGLGLFICRSIVQAAGGRMLAGNRGGGGDSPGACIEIELPIRCN